MVGEGRFVPKKSSLHASRNQSHTLPHHQIKLPIPQYIPATEQYHELPDTVPCILCGKPTHFHRRIDKIVSDEILFYRGKTIMKTILKNINQMRPIKVSCPHCETYYLDHIFGMEYYRYNNLSQQMKLYRFGELKY